MAIIDKVNEELLKLQGELEKLDSFSTQIGNAKEAADTAVKSAKQFVSEFGKSTDSIVKTMRTSSEEFQAQCKSNSESFREASERFTEQTEKAYKKLKEINEELGKAVSNIVELKSNIEALDIAGNFKKVHNGVIELKKDLSSTIKTVSQQIEELKKFGEMEAKAAKDRHNLILIFVILGLCSMWVIYFMR